MWFICVQKEPSWDPARFRHEYETVHADLVRAGHQHSGLPLSYVQFGAMDLPDPRNPGRDTDDGPWDFLTCLYWPSTHAIWKSFQNPGYRETAGKHIFCRLDQKGLLARRVGSFGAGRATSGFIEQGSFAIHVFHRRPTVVQEITEAWVGARKKLADCCVAKGGDGVQQYSAWIDVTPQDTAAFFEDTQFSGGSWHQFAAVERFVFADQDQASSFWRDNSARVVGEPGSTYVVGGSASLVV